MRRNIIWLILYSSLLMYSTYIVGQSSSAKKTIDKAYLKFNRDEAIQYALRWWHEVNSIDFVFMGSGGIYGMAGGGDCANFVSQILLNGSIRSLADGSSVYTSTGGTVIRGAKELSARLIGKFWYLDADLNTGHISAPYVRQYSYPRLLGPEFVNEIGPSNPVSNDHLSKMQKADPVFITKLVTIYDCVKDTMGRCIDFPVDPLNPSRTYQVHFWDSKQWDHIFIVNSPGSSELTTGMAGHTPHEFYPIPRKKTQIRGPSPNFSVNEDYIRALKPDINPVLPISPRAWIIPTLSIYNRHTKTLIHIPDVPVITKIELVEIDPNNGAIKSFYYRAILDDTKNGGDGQIERSAADINPVILNKDSNIQLRIYFNHPINANYNDSGETHSVKIIQAESIKVLSLPDVIYHETASLDLENPKLEDKNKKLIYRLPVDKIKINNANLKWFIKIRAFSESDDTPLNGAGTYAEYKDEADLNHWFTLGPKMNVENMEIDWLHVNPGNEALAVYNMQPLRSDGAVIFADSTFKDLYNCGTDRYSKDYNECIEYRSNDIIADNISSDYYLNMEMLQTPPSSIASLTSINDILYKMYPVYIANIRSGSSLKPFVEDNSIKNFVKLYLDITPYNKHSDRYGPNIPGAEIRNLDITDFYYAASWKDEEDAGSAMVILPLYRIFKEKPTKENGLPKLPELPDGIYKIRIETTNGALGDDKLVFNSGTLRFFKDFNSPYESSINSIRYVEDNSSGFDNQHFRMAHPSAVNIYDMAHNKIRIAENHISNDKSIVKNFGGGYNPEILTIDAVADLSTPSGVALKSKWQDQDNNISPRLTRVFLVRADSLYTTVWKLGYNGTQLPEYKPADISYVRELDLTKDLDANNIRQDGFILKNCDDLYEGDYYVKVHAEDSTYRYDDEARKININIAKPVIDDIKIDLDNRLITAKISDIGTPIEMLKIEFERPMAFQYLDNRSLIFQTRIPSGIDKMTLKVTDLAGNEVKQDFNWDMSKLPPEEPTVSGSGDTQDNGLPTQTTVITKTEINGTGQSSGILPGIPPTVPGSGGGSDITQVPITQGGTGETQVNLETFPINRGGFYNLFDLFWENTLDTVTQQDQKCQFGQVILYYWFQAPRFADYDFTKYIDEKNPQIKILIDPADLQINTDTFDQKAAEAVAGKIKFHYKDTWVNLTIKDLRLFDSSKKSYLATFDLPESLKEKENDPAVIFRMRGGEYLQEAVYEEEQPDGTKKSYTWKATYTNYPNLVYIDTASLENPVSTGLQFDVYDIDYVRTKFYINDEYIGNYSLIDQLNIRAKSCLAMGQSCENYNFGPRENWWDMFEWAKWAEEAGGWQGTYFAAKSEGDSGIQRFIYTIYRIDKFISVFIRMVEDIFNTFFEAYSLPLANVQLPSGAQPKIEKKVFVEYYKSRFETESRDTADIRYNYPILRNYYKPDYVVYEPPIPLPEGENTAKVIVYDYDGNQAVSKHKFEVVYTPRILSFGFNKNYSVENSIYAFDAYIRDYGSDVQSSNISLLIDNKEYTWKTVDLQWDNNLYKGHVSFHPAASFPVGLHKAELIITDQHGHTASQAITFAIAKIEFKLDGIIARDIEGNGDGNLNEGERIYLDLGLLNQGDLPAYEVSAELLNRSRYIKGVPEPLSTYGQISSRVKTFNMKPYEFVISDSIFSSEDIDSVSAEFTLAVKYKTAPDQEAFTTAELPFTLNIIRLDPTFSEFSLFVDRSVTETLDPNFTVKGSWLSSGCFMKELTVEQMDGMGTQLTVSRDDQSKTYSAGAVLHVGENRFLVTGTTDSGLSRTAELNVRLLSKIGIKLDAIGDTKEPNITVTGEAWTTNSRLESVKIYLNGGFAGDAAVDGGGRFSLPVTLNGGENIIRAVARDDQGKSASDEITVNMHGPLTIRWERAHQRVNETPIRVCGSYETDGDDIATIVTYVNDLPNTYETVINRDLKTFCTTADLQTGNNILRAVGTTTGGVTAEAFSRVEYNTGGVLGIEFDSLPPQGVSNVHLTGRFTLSSANPYTITVWGPSHDDPWIEYTPVIDHAAGTFYVDVTLPDPPTGCGDGECCCAYVSYYFDGYLDQDGLEEYTSTSVDQTNAICSNGLTAIDDSLFTVGTGFIQGTFILNVPGAHIADITVYVEDADYNSHEFHVTDYDEILGTWQVYADVTPSHVTSSSHINIAIFDTFGNSFGCFQHAEILTSGYKIRLDEHHRKDNKKNIIKNPERHKRTPKRSVDGGRN